MLPFFQRLEGRAASFLHRSRRLGWVDILGVLGIVGVLSGVFSFATEWHGVLRPTVEIDLSPWSLPMYTFFSLARGLIAYVFSLGFTLLYGYWAAKDPMAERVLIPLLDILQSIPVLGFMPGLVLSLVALFPTSNVGLELAAVLMIFTGQAWNMTFSYYHSLRSVPQVLGEAATVFRFDWWRRLRCVELPFATIGLVWNSMMSMAGGWFFLMVSEAFQLGTRDFRLPGLGSYMSVAVAQGNRSAMLWAVGAMTAMIVLLDQLLWRPVVVWAQKFRVEEGGAQEVSSSWILSWLNRSRLLFALRRWWRRRRRAATVEQASQIAASSQAIPQSHRRPRWAAPLSAGVFTVLLGLLAWGIVHLLGMMRAVSGANWLMIVKAAGWTMGRVLLTTALGTAWALPAGLAIGLSPRLSRIFQPIVQVVASFPAPMLFPMAIAVLQGVGVGLGWGSIVLMLLGTQWYILFNVIAGASAIPADLREAATAYRLTPIQRFWHVYVPGVFPYLVTGWVTAAGGAWNASIVAEYVTFNKQVLTTQGLGAMISTAAEKANFPLLAASVVTMAIVVVLFNRAVWRPCYQLAEDRFSLGT